MTPDFPQNDREQLEAKLTALLLGELPAHEAAALHSAMDDDPDLAELYERLKQTIALVRESTANPPAQTGPQPAPLKLSADRREKLLAHFKTVKPLEFTEPPQKRPLPFLIQLAAVVAIVALLAAMLLPALSKAKMRAQRPVVINNLRLLDGAKQTWALEANAGGSAVPTYHEVAPYFGRGTADGTEENLSIAGETYIPGKVDEAPRVETTVAQAKKWMGNRPIPESAIHNGRVQLIMDDNKGLTAVDSESPLQTMTVASAGVHQTEEIDTRLNQGDTELAMNRILSQMKGKGEDSRYANGNDSPQAPITYSGRAIVYGKAPLAHSSAPQPAATPPARTPETKTEIVLPSSNEISQGAQLALNTPDTGKSMWESAQS